MDITIRTDEGCAAQPQLQWDTIWSDSITAPQTADWVYASAQEAGNIGGLQAQNTLATAVTLLLFTDARCPKDHPLRRADMQDLKGWWGDSFDVATERGEAPLGSLLWLLRNQVATARMASYAQAMALDALQPLITQGAVASITAQASVSGKSLSLSIQLYASEGSVAYDRTFDPLWRQIFA